jgi:tol-pal system protein YbgF
MRKGSIRRGLLALLAAAAVAPLLAGCATIAEQRKLERRIADLEGGNGTPGTPGADRLADLAARLDSLDTQIGQLQGRLEVAEHRVDEALSEARAARAEAAQKGGTAGAAPAAPSAAAPGADEPAGAEVSAELKAYREARNAWSQGNADACIDRFRSFLQTYPSSTYAESASYWMADCFYKRGDYKIAVLRFDEVVARFPKGERAPDALYRQGEALLKLGPGYGKAAEKAFERVIQEYPTSDRAVEAKKQLQLLGSG